MSAMFLRNIRKILKDYMTSHARRNLPLLGTKSQLYSSYPLSLLPHIKEVMGEKLRYKFMLKIFKAIFTNHPTAEVPKVWGAPPWGDGPVVFLGGVCCLYEKWRNIFKLLCLVEIV
jgi:hypothetical protein